MTFSARVIIGAFVLGMGAPPVSWSAQAPLSSAALVASLRQGGFVLVMRHASSPRERPDEAAADAENPGLERQLDQAGRAGSAAMGQALRALKIPIGGVLTSPAYRARQTVMHARLANPTLVEELGDGGQSMQGVTERQTAWLLERVRDVPLAGNVLLVTHMPNLERAFPEWGSTVAEGEVVVLRPDGQGGAAVAARITINEWTQLP